MVTCIRGEPELLSQQHKGLLLNPGPLTYMRFSWKRFLRLSRKALSLVWASRRTKSWMPTRSRAFREDSMFLRIWLHLSSRLCIQTGAATSLHHSCILFFSEIISFCGSHTCCQTSTRWDLCFLLPTRLSFYQWLLALKCPWLHPQI